MSELPLDSSHSLTRNPQQCGHRGLHHKIVSWSGPSLVPLLGPIFASYVRDQYGDRIDRYRALVELADMRSPQKWFPFARALERKIVFHAGPTNSGKTFQALQALKNAQSGVYCGPLRLLAMEIYDRLNAEGVMCDLVTGQERRTVPGSSHVACTVEMTNLNKRVDVAVVDEIQMIGDDRRGWAWTRALLGLPANEIHLCGDTSALELVGRLCTYVSLHDMHPFPLHLSADHSDIPFVFPTFSYSPHAHTGPWERSLK